MGENGRRKAVVGRRIDVAAVEIARLEKGLSISELSATARVDPCALRNLLRYGGERSRDAVIVAVTRALGLHIRDVVTITPIRQEPQ